MKILFSFMNWLTDMDWGWWPLLKCRPPRDQKIDASVLMKITPFFGTVVGILIAVIRHQMKPPTTLILWIIVGWVLFFILYRLTFAVAWNVRAKQMRKT